MEAVFRWFERVIIIALIIILAVTVFISVVELGGGLATDLMFPSFLLLEVEEILDVFACSHR